MFARVGRRYSQERKAARVFNEHPLRVADEELRILMSTVQDLIERLATAADPELKRLRKQAEGTLAGARTALGESGPQPGDRARRLTGQGQAFVQRRPMTSVGIVALGMLAIGLVTGRALASE